MQETSGNLCKFKLFLLLAMPINFKTLVSKQLHHALDVTGMPIPLQLRIKLISPLC